MEGEIRAALELEKGTALTKPIQDYLFAFDRLCYGDGPCRFIKPSGSLREHLRPGSDESGFRRTNITPYITPNQKMVP